MCSWQCQDITVSASFLLQPTGKTLLSNGYESARLNMVEGQIRPNKVTDPAVIAAFLDVPREIFVPGALRGAAYVDEDLPLGGGRYLVEPMVLARLLQFVGVAPSERVLEIGAASGYATSLLSRLAREVVAVEADAALARAARESLAKLGIANARVVEGALDAGCPASAPYEVILFGGAVAEIPEAIEAQLAEGGRLAAVVRHADGLVGNAVLVQKRGNSVVRRVLFDAATPLLPGFEPQRDFVF